MLKDVPNRVNGSRLRHIALKLRSIISEEIARNLTDVKLERKVIKEALSNYLFEEGYYPVDDASTVILLTHSTLHCSLRFLACLIDVRIRQGRINPAILRYRMEKVEHSNDIPSILRPFAYRQLEFLRIKILQEALEIVRSLSNFECLLMMGTLYERSYWELIVPCANRIGKHTDIYTNLAFANRKGIFHTPPEIADFIVEKTFGNFINESTALSIENTLMQLKACDPACGSSIFLLFYLKRLFDFLHKDRNDLVRKILKSMIYGVDIENTAIQISQVVLCLFSGIGLDKISTVETNLKVGNSLISEELLGSPINPKRIQEKLSISAFFNDNTESIQAFNWSEKYPELFLYSDEGGFDFIFLNPPYGRLKAYRSDFIDKETLSRFSGERLETELINIKANLSAMTRYFRECGDYTLSCSGELDWYRLMFERALRLLKKEGRLGCIIPSTILADMRSAPIRKYLLDNYVLEHIYYLPESIGLFDTVNQATCILIIRKRAVPKAQIGITKCDNYNNLLNMRSTSISLDIIRSLNSNLVPIPAINKSGYSILEKMKQFSSIGDIKQLINKRGELDLTLHKEYISGNESDYLLVRGDNVERFVCRCSSQSRKKVRVKSIFLKNIGRPTVTYVNSERIVGRQCSYIKKKRRLSFTIVDRNSIVSNSCNYLISKDCNNLPLLYVLGILNSSLMEWRFRITNSNNHVSNYEIDQLRLPLKNRNLVLSKIIIEAATDLMGYYSNLAFGNSKRPTGPDEDRLDSAIFLLYGITEKEADFVLKELGESWRSSSVRGQMNKIMYGGRDK